MPTAGCYISELFLSVLLVEVRVVLLLSKILVTFLTVAMLAIVARRYGPAWAGVLAGFPLGSAITLYFIGYEQGAEFAADGARHALIGLAGSLMLAITYLYASRRWHQPKAILMPVLLAPLAFLITVAPLQYWQGEWWLNTVLILGFIWLARQRLRRVEDVNVVINRDNIWQRPVPAIFFRAGMATLSVVGITALAHWLSPSQAGLLAAFPVSFFPVLIILQLSYGAPVVAATVKQYPGGLVAMVIYIVLVGLTYPIAGLHWGTALSLAGATLYLIGYAITARKLRA